ncbi:MAG: single-stranded-DNA-specific exonuclease RecJ [Oxalobacter sp.]|nr:single-stranded-DNA-specific exonuclease RecJ [Oxalobacter sp.]
MSRIEERAIPDAACKALILEGVHPVLAKILSARGIVSKEELANTFSHLIPPNQMLNLDKAATLLADTIDAGQKMTVVADYDCDGATACAVAVLGIRMLGGKIDFVVPSRFDNGYGLTPAISEMVKYRHGADLLITVDNGISSVEGVAKAVELGMKVLVTDHHLPGEHIPQNCVIVNPNQKGCPFPSKNLAGVGVIFYVLLGLRAELRKRGRFAIANQPKLDNLLDLVALGTVADIVPLDHNNRILVSQGLLRIKRGMTRPGVRALFRVSSRSTMNASVSDLGFVVGPRLNAAGRLADMAMGVNCLLTNDNQKAFTFANELDRINRERQQLEESMRQDVQAMTGGINARDVYTICMASSNWHQGVVGLLATRIRETHYRPAIIFTEDKKGNLQGSGRSIPHLHIRDAIAQIAEEHPGVVLKFGGHAMAAGLTIAKDALEVFKEAFEQVAREHLTPEQLVPVIDTDGPLDMQYLNEGFIELLDSQTWGQGFPPPLFYDEFTVKNQRILKNTHLKLELVKDGKRYEAIQFRNNVMLPEKVKLVYRPCINEFNNNRSIQLNIQAVAD